jgi:hypothetical protein
MKTNTNESPRTSELIQVWRQAKAKADALAAAKVEEVKPPKEYDADWRRLWDLERELVKLSATCAAEDAAFSAAEAASSAVDALDARDSKSIATYRGLRAALGTLEAEKLALKAEYEAKARALEAQASKVLRESIESHDALNAARIAADEPAAPRANLGMAKPPSTSGLTSFEIIGHQGPTNPLDMMIGNVDAALGGLASRPRRKDFASSKGQIGALCDRIAALKERLVREKASRDGGASALAWEADQRQKRQEAEAADWAAKVAKLESDRKAILASAIEAHKGSQ